MPGDDFGKVDLLKWGGIAVVFLLGLIGGLWQWVSTAFQKTVPRDEFSRLEEAVQQNGVLLAVVDARQQDVRVGIVDIKRQLAALNIKVDEVRQSVLPRRTHRDHRENDGGD
jgi:hypothetical protein